MKIWFTEIGEPLPLEPDARLLRYGQISRQLVRRGHEVTWWSSTFLHARKRHFAEADGVYDVDGVTLRLLHGPGYRRNVSVARIRHQRAFAKAFARAAAGQPSPDIIISPVPTIEVATEAIRYGRRLGVPVVVDIRDEWPDEFLLPLPKTMRPLGRLALAPYYRMMRNVCAGAAAIVGVSERQLGYGLRFAGRPKGPLDRVIAHGYSAEPVAPEALAAAQDWWAERGIAPGPLTACFFGTLGTVFNIDLVIAAVRRLAGKIDLRVVICGDGPARAEFERLAADLPSVIFPGWVGNSQIAALMAMSDIGLAPYGPSDDKRMSLPNKPFEYMAGGLPILSSIEGELVELLSAHDCGVSYDPRSVEALMDGFLFLAADAERRRAMGVRGRELFLKQFSHQRIVDSFEALCEEVVKRRQPAAR